MAKKKGNDDNEPKTPAWMVTYGDMMTLLLTFFVLLLSFSSIQETKFHEAMGSLQKAFGVMETSPFVLKTESPPMPKVTDRAKRQVRQQMEKVKTYLSESGVSGHVEVAPTTEGFVIRLNNPLLFDTGKAKIKTDGKEILGRIIEIVDQLDNRLRVEGHTDNVPINNPEFPSNWELSTARALSVLKMMRDHEVEPTRLSAAGYGEFKPLVANDSEEHRQQNRRVEIHVKTESLSPPDKPWFLEEEKNG